MPVPRGASKNPRRRLSLSLTRGFLLILVLRGATFSYFYRFSEQDSFNDAVASLGFSVPSTKNGRDVYTQASSSITRGGTDTRPVAKKGYICVDKTQGRLNNIIIQLLVILNVGQTINRTVLVTENMASAFEFYDFDHFNLKFQQTKSPSTFLPMLVDRSIDKCYNGTGIPKGGSSISKRIQQFDRKTLGEKVAIVGGKSSWYFLGRPKPPFYADFFSALWPTKAISIKVDQFLQNTFQGKPFVAVHLRNLEGACTGMTESLELCCPTRDTVMGILQRKGVSLEIPIFVANDKQCPDSVINGYKSKGDVLGFNRDCEGSECAVLDFEICVQATLFVGTLASTADMNIREMRTERRKLPGSTSILSLKEETWKKENATALTRNWIPGAFKWIKDCENAKKNRFPCV